MEVEEKRHRGGRGGGAPRSDAGAVRKLGDAVGIIPDYLDQTGKERRITTDESRIAVLAAMGIDASTPARATEALAAIRAESRAELLAPVRVVQCGPGALAAISMPLPAAMRDVRWSVELIEETGAVHRTEGKLGAGRVTLTFATAPSTGYHSLRLRVTADGREHEAEQSLIVVPSHCTLPAEVLGDRKAYGIVANLYSVYSERNWGIGDFTDLATIARWAGEAGAEFVGVNPLHALLDRGDEVSPYSPVSRLFRNVAYLDVEAIPELHGDPRLVERIAHPELRAELAALREDSQVRYEQVMTLKAPVLEELYRRFADREREGNSPRARAYRDYLAAQGEELTRFATWMAIGERREREHREANGGAWSAGAFDWRRWPEPLRSPSSAAVARFVEEHADRVDYHRWLQFECDRQLGIAAASARQAGLRIGLYQDLAIGTSPAGSDTWSWPQLFVRGANVGAPPDPYSDHGQNWGLPPIDPREMRRDRYRYFVRLVRAGFRHAGALRIDHVMGLFRLFWIPEGRSGKEGVYVRYPADELLGILALESVRHRALVVGEDLGTVPREVPPMLEKWGILSSKVLYFERDRRGAFRGAEKYAPLSLATANTHDMATIAGFWRGRDVELRAEKGLIDATDGLAAARAERERDRQALLKRLQIARVLPRSERGAPPSDADARWEATLRDAVHAFLCRTPSVLVGLSLDDITGEVEAVNLPGVGPDRYPSWRRRMRTALEELPSPAGVRAATGCADRGAVAGIGGAGRQAAREE